MRLILLERPTKGVAPVSLFTLRSTPWYSVEENLELSVSVSRRVVVIQEGRITGTLRRTGS